MNYRVTFSVEAEIQLAELEDYLAERFYPRNAERFIARITKTCLALGKGPWQGTNRDDLGPNVRCIGFERRVAIYFQIRGDEVKIAGIFYGGEQPLMSFDPESP